MVLQFIPEYNTPSLNHFFFSYRNVSISPHIQNICLWQNVL